MAEAPAERPDSDRRRRARRRESGSRGFSSPPPDEHAVDLDPPAPCGQRRQSQPIAREGESAGQSRPNAVGDQRHLDMMVDEAFRFVDLETPRVGAVARRSGSLVLLRRIVLPRPRRTVATHELDTHVARRGVEEQAVRARSEVGMVSCPSIGRAVPDFLEPPDSHQSFGAAGAAHPFVSLPEPQGNSRRTPIQVDSGWIRRRQWKYSLDQRSSFSYGGGFNEEVRDTLGAG